jgi:hypothetical protein
MEAPCADSRHGEGHEEHSPRVQRAASMSIWVSHSNEWLEGSQIETSAGYGDFYLNLTAELAAAYRQGAPAALGAVPTEPSPPAETVAPTEEPQPTAPPPTDTPTPLPTDTPAPTPTLVPTPSPSPSLSPTATSAPTSTPSPTSTPPPTPTPTPSPAPTPTLADRAATWPWGGWALGAGVALLAARAVAHTLRLRRELVGKSETGAQQSTPPEY